MILRVREREMTESNEEGDRQTSLSLSLVEIFFSI